MKSTSRSIPISPWPKSGSSRALGVDDDEDDDDERAVDDEFDDEAEMQLLHELGIDLDAPDGDVGLDFELEIAQEDPADDGVAA